MLYTGSVDDVISTVWIRPSAWLLYVEVWFLLDLRLTAGC